MYIEVTPRTKSIRFLKRIFHPNVAADGTLRFSKSLRKAGTFYEMKDIAEKLLSQPDLRPEYIANPTAASIYRKNISLYFKRARASA